MCAANGTAAAVNVWRCTVITPAICLQPLLRDKITALAGTCEMETRQQEKEAEKFRAYVKEQDTLWGKERQA